MIFANCSVRVIDTNRNNLAQSLRIPHSFRSEESTSLCIYIYRHNSVVLMLNTNEIYSLMCFTFNNETIPIYFH